MLPAGLRGDAIYRRHIKQAGRSRAVEQTIRLSDCARVDERAPLAAERGRLPPLDSGDQLVGERQFQAFDQGWSAPTV